MNSGVDALVPAADGVAVVGRVTRIMMFFFSR